uniref:Secreted protein n=1 Tax=Panagrellus redivivus TaxID=6233 RepID=A0A7E4VWV6_PANRE
MFVYILKELIIAVVFFQGIAVLACNGLQKRRKKFIPSITFNRYITLTPVKTKLTLGFCFVGSVSPPKEGPLTDSVRILDPTLRNFQLQNTLIWLFVFGKGPPGPPDITFPLDFGDGNEPVKDPHRPTLRTRAFLSILLKRQVVSCSCSSKGAV